MERYEMAELLSKKANVTLEEARQALAENEWDLLDAMVALERRGRTALESVTVDRGAGEEGAEPRKVKNTAPREPVFTNGFATIWHYIKRLCELSVQTSFTVLHREKEVFSVPVLVMLILVICCFWVVVPALVIGLFVGCSYRFEGKKAAEAANRAMDKLGGVVLNIKDTLDSSD